MMTGKNDFFAGLHLVLLLVQTFEEKTCSSLQP